MSARIATVAVAGSGDLAEAHARVAVAHPDLRLVALIDADLAAATGLAEKVVSRFEGERPPIFPDLVTALGSVDIDLVALAGFDDGTASAAARAGKAIVGGDPALDHGLWFPFAANAPTGADDSAFTDHVRQYEGVLGRLGFGPQPASAEAGR